MRRRVLAVLCIVLLPFCGELRAQQQASPELVDMVIGFLTDSDTDIRAIAFDHIRTEAAGAAATRRFAAELPGLSAEVQIGLLRALGNRGDDVAKPAVTALLSASSDVSLRVAAIHALGKLGDATDCPALIKLLAATSGPTRRAARESLVQLRDTEVLPAIVDALDRVEAPTRVALVEILTARRELGAIPTLLNLATGQVASDRAAAMASLGILAGPAHIGAMTRGVLRAAKGAERSAAEKCLMFVCNRIEDKEKRADALLRAMTTLEPSDQIVMLSTLGRVGGSAALQEVDKAIANPQGAVHAAGFAAISNWPDASVAARLIELARADAHANHRRTARMALIRISPLPDGRTDGEKLELLKTAFELTENDAERNYALKRCAAIRILATLRFVLPYVQQGPLAQQACQTVVELAHDRKLRDDNKPEFHAALDKVLAATTDSVVIERANRYKNGQTWARPR